MSSAAHPGDTPLLMLARGLGQLLVTVGMLVLLFCVYQLYYTNVLTAQSQDKLSEELIQSWAADPRPAPLPAPTSSAAPSTKPAAPALAAPAELGDAFMIIRVPRLGSNYAKVVVEGVTPRALKKGPGHYPGTALPGELGNVVISGHRTTYGGPFGNIQRLRQGDPIVLETAQARYTYRLTETKIVSPDAIEVTFPVPGEPRATPTRKLLTLTTCHPRYSARQRYIVHAELDSVEPKSP